MHLWRSNQKSSPCTTQIVHVLEGLFGIYYLVFLKLALVLSETTKPTIALTGKKLATCFFLTKTIPPRLGTACDDVLQFSFEKALIACSLNTAADLFSRLEFKVTDKVRLKIRADLQTTPIEVTTPSSDVTDEGQFTFTQSKNENESEEQTLKIRM